MKFLAVVLLAVAAVSADVRDARRSSRQAIILSPQQLLRQPQLQLEQPQLQLVRLQQPQQQLEQPQLQLVRLQQPQLQLEQPQLQLVRVQQPQPQPQLVRVQQPQQQLVRVQQPQQQLVRVQQVAQPVLVQPQFQAFHAQEPHWRILKQSQEVDPIGNYRFSFETENGIRAAEEGAVLNAGSNAETTAKRGGFAYTAPDGTPISLTYVADENGFRASGAHLPTPPPIPEAILRSLEQNAREEAAGGFSK